jgi:hypothetical protein
MREPRTYQVSVRPWDMTYLLTGQKHFIVMEEPTGGIGYGDVLILTHPAWSQPLIRWVRYAESGLGYGKNYIGVELAP